MLATRWVTATRTGCLTPSRLSLLPAPSCRSFHLQAAGIKFKLRLAHLLFLGCLMGLYCETRLPESCGSIFRGLPNQLVNFAARCILFPCPAAVSYDSASTAAHRYHEHRDQGSGLHTLLLKKFVAERNVWIWAFATTLYLISFQLWVLFSKFVELAEKGIIAKADADADKARAKDE